MLKDLKIQKKLNLFLLKGVSNMATDKIGMVFKVEGLERMKECSENLKFTLQQLTEVTKELNECSITISRATSLDKVPDLKDDFGPEDVDLMISDLQEEFYRLDSGNAYRKASIALSIDRLWRLKKKMESK